MQQLERTLEALATTATHRELSEAESKSLGHFLLNELMGACKLPPRQPLLNSLLT